MTRTHLLASTAILLGFAASANAAPLYVGLQAGSGTISAVALTANTPANTGFSFAQTQIGTTGIYASGTIEGTPPLAEPDLMSATTDVSGSHNGGGTVSIYVTETNMFPNAFNSYFSDFASTLPTFFPNSSIPNTAVVSITESIYEHDCALPAPNGCNATTDVFALDHLIASATFSTVAGHSYTSNQIDPITAGLTTPYAITEVYTLTLAPGSLTSYGDIQNTISMSVPEPVSISMLGMGMIGLGLARNRRA